MKTSDWASVLDAKYLLVGEHSTLQWSDEVVEYAMFLDYYFSTKPYDLGERSRYSEAKNIFTYLKEMTNQRCTPELVHGTLICYDPLNRPPKGKHTLLPAEDAKKGYLRIKRILEENPTIKYIFVMGMQANYHLQKLGFYSCGEQGAAFLKGAEPARAGLLYDDKFYQPVNAKPFREICFKPFEVADYDGVKIIPILPHKSYPLYDANFNNFGDSFAELTSYFQNQE